MSASQSAMGADAGERAQKLVLDQLGLALRNLKPNAWMMPALAAVICIMFHKWIGWPRLMVWFGIVIATCIPLGIVAHRFGKSRAADPRAGMLAATLSYFVFTLGWSSLGNGALVGPSR